MASGNEKNFELKIGKTGIIVVVTGMTMLLCGAFLFGVDVGKNIDTYPGKIASLPQKALAMVWRPAKMKMAQTATDTSINLNYHDTLIHKKELPDPVAPAEKKPEVPAPVADEEIPKGKFHIETDDHPATAEQNIAENMTAKINGEIKSGDDGKASREPKDKKDVSKDPAHPDSFIVQVAALKEKSKAEPIHKKVASLGFKPEIVKADLQGKGVVFRVIVSGFDDKLQAQNAAEKINKNTGEHCIVKKTDKK
jgi:cell division septation protein DedD